MSFLKKLFGGGDVTGAQSEAEVYEGFKITPTPIAEDGAYRVSALIEKNIDGEARSHKLIRADTVQGKEAAQEASINKAKQVIDEQGTRIFR